MYLNEKYIRGRKNIIAKEKVIDNIESSNIENKHKMFSKITNSINLYKLNQSPFISSKSKKLKENQLNHNTQLNNNQNITLEYGDAKTLFVSILSKAVSMHSSDIHIEPFEEYLITRVRVDGELKEIERFSIDIYLHLSTLIKLEASMDITEKRLPQDGSMTKRVNNTVIDIRASSINTIYGEKIVLRILDRNTFLKSKEELGFSENAISKINNIIKRKSGILMVTGSTGSGKTTTVYSILNGLKNERKNIMTIEDPVEYKMDNINQIQVNHKFGLDFETGLRSILRQDPDVIMIGEIRDKKTAQIAIRAAITGHLVISTMHTNDAISTITRLVDMGIDPYLISTSLTGIISQKLVKKICVKCNKEINIEDYLDNEISMSEEKGCEECNDGYIGRTAIYEIIDIDDEIRTLIKDKRNDKYIKDIAIKNGMITFEDSIRYIIKK